MNFNIITLFPEFFYTPLRTSLLGKSFEKKIVTVNFIQLRDFAINKHGQVDDRPYGGGPGMILRVEPIISAIESLSTPGYKVLLGTRGEVFTQKKARELSQKKNVTLICGHYEGVDERVTNYVDETLRIGDYVLSGGESAGLVILEAVARLQLGFTGNPESLISESFSELGLIEYPQYTRPAEFRGEKVSNVLLSGHHQKIESWRRSMSLKVPEVEEMNCDLNKEK